MHQFQYLVHSRRPGDQEPFDRVFSSETSRREFLRRAAAVGISASAAMTLLGALAERTVAAAGADILTAQSVSPSLTPGGWGPGYLATYLTGLAAETPPPTWPEGTPWVPIPVAAIGGVAIETDGDGHILMISVKDKDDQGNDVEQEVVLAEIKAVFEGHEVDPVSTVWTVLDDGLMAGLPAALVKLAPDGQSIDTLIMGQDPETNQLAVQVTLAPSAVVSPAQA
jgi:hypothetical protein